MRLTAFLFILLSPLPLFGQARQVCFTIDDLPVVSYGVSDTAFQKELTQKLVQSLMNNSIPAIGFVNEGKLYNGEELLPSSVDLLEIWLENGLDLGNHSYSHPDFNHSSFKDFSLDVLKGEKVTKKLLDDHGKTMKYFRHPYLHVGNRQGKADSLSTFLAENGYTVAPVTLDNEEYLFAFAYHKANRKQNDSLKHRIGHDYIDYMEKKLKYFERQSHKLFGRNIKHILLIHANLLNADYMDLLAKRFRDNGYEFIDLDKALEDELYQTEINRYGDWGISWLDRWALSRGEKGDFFKDEPQTPDYIRDLAER